jgi:hypothetical protein
MEREDVCVRRVDKVKKRQLWKLLNRLIIVRDKDVVKVSTTAHKAPRGLELQGS